MLCFRRGHRRHGCHQRQSDRLLRRLYGNGDHPPGRAAVFVSCAQGRGRQRLFPGVQNPAWMYLGGVIGILTTLFNNFAFGKISMTGLVALSLFGETVTALTIDVTGLFGMQKRRMKPRVLVGLVFSLAGILLMLRQARGGGALRRTGVHRRGRYGRAVTDGERALVGLHGRNAQFVHQPPDRAWRLRACAGAGRALGACRAFRAAASALVGLFGAA